MRRSIFSVLLSCLLLLLSASFVFAAVPQDVQQAANDGLKNFIHPLNDEKSHFGLDSNDSPDTAVVGQGQEVYVVSSLAMKAYDLNKSTVPKSVDLFVPNDTYIFPVHVGNKPAGILWVEKINGKWEATQLSSYLTFETDLKNATDNINTILGPSHKPSAIKFIYDQSIGLVGLGVEGVDDEFIMPMKDNAFLKLTHNNKALIKDHVDTWLSILKDRNPNLQAVSPSDIKNGKIKTGGLGGVDNGAGQGQKLPWVWIIFITILGAIGAYIGLRKLAYKE